MKTNQALKKDLSSIERRALGTPRADKNPRSIEYAVQTRYLMRLVWQQYQFDEEKWQKERKLVEEHEVWKHFGCKSCSEFLEKEIGATAEAIALKKRGAQGGNKNAAKDKTPDQSGQENEPCNARFVYGTRDHWIARLRRDNFTELADKVESGEMSANAAAIEAGFRKKPTPLHRLEAAWKKCSEDERREFLRSKELKRK